VNDGSRDRTLEIFRELADKDERVRYISLSRNFGKESAMYAGLKASKGDYVVVMDADLQHPPAFLPQMYNYVKDGEFDCATTRRVSRKGESKIRSFFARLFYKIMNKISQTEIVDGAQDFRFMSRQMVDAVLDMSEYNRFSKGIFSWVGFRVKYMPYENVERPAGTSSWSFWGLFKYSLEGIMAFSTAPLAISSLLGIISCITAFILMIITVIKTIAFGEDVAGYPTTICVIFLLSGLQLFCTGILGQYLSKTYLETKNRPIYISKETAESYREKQKERSSESSGENASSEK
jgi:glycosyltransferase involved in cell wall biosynthesis